MSSHPQPLHPARNTLTLSLSHPTSPLVPRSPRLPCPSPCASSQLPERCCSGEFCLEFCTPTCANAFRLLFPTRQPQEPKANGVSRRRLLSEQRKTDCLPQNHKVQEPSEAWSDVSKAPAYLSPLTDTFHTPLSASHCPRRSAGDRLLSQGASEMGSHQVISQVFSSTQEK